jgi:hypothetical protein
MPTRTDLPTALTVEPDRGTERRVYDMAIWGDYFRRSYYHRQHHARFVAYVERNGLICQECGGRGGETDVILDDGTGPWEECGFCEGTGMVTRWIRGQWLRWKREERKAKTARTS